MLAVGLMLTLTAIPVAAAAGWWVPAPIGSRSISAVASNQGSATLAISKGVPGWYRPTSGSFSPLAVPGAVSAPGPAAAVAARDGVGVAAYRSGLLLQVSQGGGSRRLPSVPGVPRALALVGGDPQLLAVATSRGLFSGRLGSRLALVAAGEGRAVIPPPHAGRAWLALVDGRLWDRSAGGGWARAPGSPRFDRQTQAVAELSTGVILVGEPGGLIWRGDRGRWDRALQLLPYGGLGGVPQVTALVADGATSAYLGTEGFGTLLTTDAGYTWYRAAPSDRSISSLATVGPVFAAHAHGFVVAISAGGVFLHRLQALPAPPIYGPTSQTMELVGTAVVTLLAALLVTLLLWYLTRRERRLSV